MKIKIEISLVLILILSITQFALCDESRSYRFASDVSDSTKLFLISGELLLLSDKENGKTEMIQGAKALVTAKALTEILKSVVREKRPNSESLASFPSGHTAVSFAMATVLADYQPYYKWFAYGTATVIGWSRVELGEHRWSDVAAGAILGYYTAKHFTNQQVSFSTEGINILWKF